MKRFGRSLLTGLISAVIFLPLAASADEHDPGTLLNVLVIDVKSGHDAEFRDGVAAYKACYLEHDGEGTWNFWQQMNGKGGTYVGAWPMASWAEMDEADEAGRACREVVREQISPHVKSTESNFARTIPELSRDFTEVSDVVWVTFFRVDDVRLFRSTIDSITSAMREAEGAPRGYWYEVMGGSQESAHYWVVTPFDNFAALDESRDGVFTVVEKARGEEEAERVRADARKAVESIWSYLYHRVADLSHMP